MRVTGKTTKAFVIRPLAPTPDRPRREYVAFWLEAGKAVYHAHDFDLRRLREQMALAGGYEPSRYEKRPR